MKRLISFALVAVLVLLASSVAFARGAPQKQKAFTHQAIVVDVVVPNVELRSVPPLTVGYDVVCNLTTSNFAGMNVTDTSESLGLSTTVAKQSGNGAANVGTGRSAPYLVLRA